MIATKHSSRLDYGAEPSNANAIFAEETHVSLEEATKHKLELSSGSDSVYYHFTIIQAAKKGSNTFTTGLIIGAPAFSMMIVSPFSGCFVS